MTIPALGDVCLLLKLLTSVYACFGGLFAYWRRHQPLLESVRGAVIAVALCLSMAVFSLEYLLIIEDFSVRAVYIAGGWIIMTGLRKSGSSPAPSVGLPATDV